MRSLLFSIIRSSVAVPVTPVSPIREILAPPMQEVSFDPGLENIDEGDQGSSVGCGVQRQAWDRWRLGTDRGLAVS